MALAAVEELADYLGGPLTGARSAQAELCLDLASAMVRSYTRQAIDFVEDDVVTLVGTNHWELTLPEQPVVSVTSVVVDGLTVAEGGWQVRTDGTVVRADGWGPAGAVVTVTYTHGWEVVPRDIVGATLQLAARLMANPQGVTQEGIGTYNVTYATSAADRSALAGLDRYRRRAWSAPLGGDRPARLPVP